MRKWITMVASLLLVSAMAVGCGNANNNNAENKPAEQAPAGNTGGTAAGGAHEDAQKLFQARCTTCHGQDMRGNVDLTKVGSRYKSADEIKTVLMKGKNGMPGGLVTEDEAKKLADWLITMK